MSLADMFICESFDTKPIFNKCICSNFKSTLFPITDPQFGYTTLLSDLDSHLLQALISLRFNHSFIVASTDIANAEFICGKAEDVLPTITNRLPRNTNVVAVVDPPRAGLRKGL